MKYFRKSLAPSTFLAPFGMKACFTATRLGTGLPSWPCGNAWVMISL